MDKNTGVFLLSISLFLVIGRIVQADENSYNFYYMQIGQATQNKDLFKRSLETNASKCYHKYDRNFGCFDLNYPWTSEHRPVSTFPEEIDKIEPQYLLHTRGNNPVQMHLSDVGKKLPPNLKPKNPIYLITHGYIESGSISWIHNIARVLLSQEDCNVIIIDWQKGSGPPFTQAVANIRLVGAITAHLLASIANQTGTQKLDHVHAIGHSLGAHMCGYIGYTLQEKFNLTMGRISGLDPAEPHFAKAGPPVRLDRTAAKYVDVIHTDASQFIRGGLGIVESIGHVDYYPNGGTDQPGCTSGLAQYIRDANGSFFNGMKKYLGCNHIRSHEFYLESITSNPQCKFLTVSCPSFQDFTLGRCFGCGKSKENCIPFGFHGRKHYEKHFATRSKQTSRIQYLITGENKPFCKHHYRIVVQVSNSNVSKIHGGEVGQLYFTMHSTSNGRGRKSTPVGFVSGFHEPGSLYMGVVATDSVPHLRAVEIEWRFNSSLFNPLTWRLWTQPQIYLKKITVESLENEESVTVCPKWQKALVNGVPQLMIPSYCKMS
ncbi:unnamed protein product [Phyllotreta striolata]|uniref:Lipase domain-containing protein n=1 Tax=Phyllotreta striolata TaxID=444603 RepID=A0A9N9TPV1_PHYSR|nr:unnamed protein product [Phyllotreta striolata]